MTTQAAVDRLSVFGTFVHAVDRATVTETISQFLTDGRPHHIVTVNLDFLREARASEPMMEIINRADLSVADGVPVLWFARYVGLKGCERITGPDLIEVAAALSVSHGAKIFLLGGTEEAVAGAQATLQKRFPGVRICGSFAPPAAEYPFPAHIENEIAARLRSAEPDLLFVGFGCPKQEFWIRDHLEEFAIPVSVGIGGSFNFLSGLTPRAPKRLQRFGLEWVYRLWTEPRRLWRRYLLQDMPFLLKLLLSEALARFNLSRTRALSAQPRTVSVVDDN